MRDIVMGDGEDDDEIGIRGANRRRSEASLKRFREKARAVFAAPQKVDFLRFRFKGSKTHPHWNTLDKIQLLP